MVRKVFTWGKCFNSGQSPCTMRKNESGQLPGFRRQPYKVRMIAGQTNGGRGKERLVTYRATHQISKYFKDNGSQASHHWRKDLRIWRVREFE